MKLQSKRENDIVVFDLYGSVEMLNYAGFESAIKDFFQGEEKKLLLDCSNLAYVSSTGLRVFMTAYKQALENGVLMAVCNLQDSVQYVFDVTGFRNLLNVYEDKEEALAFLED